MLQFNQRIFTEYFMTNRLINFLNSSYTAYHATKNAKDILLENGFLPLLETEDWNLQNISLNAETAHCSLLLLETPIHFPLKSLRHTRIPLL